jgi:hypothetical protein
MDLGGALRALLVRTASVLKGTARRVFMAETVKMLGKGGQRQAERELGWSRHTVRKGEHERRTGIACVDAFSARGARPIESRLPNLRSDIQAIVEPHIQTDPTFQTRRLYRRITSAEVRRQLIEEKGYSEQEVPCEDTIRVRLNDMGYRPMKVRKSKPKKRSPRPMLSSVN